MRKALCLNWLCLQRFRSSSLSLLPTNSSLSSSSCSVPPVPKRVGFDTSFLAHGFPKGYFSWNSSLLGSLSTSEISSTVKEQMESENKMHNVQLSVVEDLYDGVIVEMKEPIDATTFIPLLRASISYWRQQGKKGFWVKLPIELANLVEPVVQEGFTYHHAEPDYLMLVRWMPNTPNTLPANASHRVGIGAFVINSNREVLVVKEKTGGFKNTGVWKLPTGVVNEGEDIFTAAIREVKEEIGIDAEFLEVLAFRQSHQSFFRKSDLFLVCMLRPLSLDIKKQDSELEAAKWMPIEDYLDQPYHKEHQLFKYVAEICKTKLESDYVGFTPLLMATACSKETYLYFNSRDFNKTFEK